MSSISKFKKRFLKDAVEKTSHLKTVKIFQSNDEIYFISDGLMKKEIKSEVEKLYSESSLEKIFVSIIENRNSINQNKDMLLNTYVWVENEPGHTIHYTSNPIIKPRSNHNLNRI